LIYGKVKCVDHKLDIWRSLNLSRSTIHISHDILCTFTTVFIYPTLFNKNVFYSYLFKMDNIYIYQLYITSYIIISLTLCYLNYSMFD